jgi:hypothetical protein
VIESDSIVNLAFHTMLGGAVTIVPSHFEMVIGGFPGTRLVKLVEPEVVRQVGLIWVDGDPMLPMAKAMLQSVKDTAIAELLRTPAPRVAIARSTASRQSHGHGPRSRAS